MIDYQLKQCLFGEHLLNNDQRPIVIVDSEKTAIIASACLPQFLWMATGGMSNLTSEKMRVLTKQTVVLFPDVKCHYDWRTKMDKLTKQMPGTRFIISDLLDQYAADNGREEDSDIADYLIRKRFQAYPTVNFESTRIPDWSSKTVSIDIRRNDEMILHPDLLFDTS